MGKHKPTFQSVTGQAAIEQLNRVDDPQWRNLALKDAWFVSKLRVNKECWEWMGTLKSGGYGYFRRRPNQYLAHRYSLEIALGRPVKLFACHKCDNPRCVRPSHLFEGSNRDNIRDAAEKNRCAFGSRHGRTKLTASDAVRIVELNADGISQVRLAEIFGVNQSAISFIIRGVNWRRETTAARAAIAKATGKVTP